MLAINQATKRAWSILIHVSALKKHYARSLKEYPLAAAMLFIAGIATALLIGQWWPIAWSICTAVMIRIDIHGMGYAVQAQTTKQLAMREPLMLLTAIPTVLLFVLLPTWMLMTFEYSFVMGAMALFAAGSTRSASMFAISKLVGAACYLPYVLVPSIMLFWDAAYSTERPWGGHLIGILALACCLLYIWNSWLTRHSAEVALDISRTEAESQRDLATRDAMVSRLLFQHTSMRAALFDHEGRFIAVNASWLGAIAKTEVEVLGRTLPEAMPDANADWPAAINNALLGNRSKAIGDARKRLDGADVFLDWEVQPWYNTDGSIGGAVAYAQDVTEVHAARAAAKLKQERLELALKASKAFIWEVDYANKSVSFDADAVAFYGKEPTFEMVSKKDHSTTHQDDLIAGKRQALRIANNGGYGRMETREIGIDGEIRWVRSDVAPTGYTNGVATSFVLMTSDITEEMRRHERLASMMERAKTALTEKRKLLEELCGETTLSVEERSGERLETKALEASDTTESTFTHLFAGFDQILTEIDDRDMALAAAVQQLRDARTNAEAANLAKSQFLANMSHELRTPLNAIIGYTEILIEDAEYEGRDDAAKDATKVRTSATHLLKLINEILDLSKIEAGKMDISREPTPLGDVLADIVSSGEPLALVHNNKIKVDIDSDRTLALTDGFRLRQCLLNLVSNACKFTENGNITLGLHMCETDENHRWFDISVQDTGIGISSEQIERLFRPFSQADGSTTRKYGGTGLGLALTREMTHLLGGEVFVESEVGVGSKFTLRIPALGLEAGDVELTKGADVSSALILVVDDDPLARTLTGRSAAALGMSVACAETGRAALAFCDENDVGLIVLDLQLPDMDGYEVLAALRGSERTRNTPVMVVSVDDDRRKSISAGAQEHLAKPCPSAVLTAAIARLARSQHNKLKTPGTLVGVASKTKANDLGLPTTNTKRSA
jgi:PAS domain S-box-containing protein